MLSKFSGAMALVIATLPSFTSASDDVFTRSDARIANAAAACGDSELRYFENSNILCVNARIDTDGALAGKIEKFDLGPHVLLVIKSPGGGLMQALRIFRHLRKYDYDVVTDGICASACAQIIFLGADDKAVLSKGVIAFHGRPIEDATIDAMDVSDEVKANLKREQIEFRNFYREVGVDIALISVLPDRFADDFKPHEQFWVPNCQELTDAGVHGFRPISSTAFDCNR